MNLIRLTFVYLLTFVILACFQACSAQNTPGSSATPVAQRLSGSVTEIAGMSAKRAAHTATLMKDGKVLVTGGFVPDGGGLASTELFDSRSNAFEKGPDMLAARSSHTATLLSDGRVLIVGGFDGNYLGSAEIFDPATKKFATTGRMTMGRSGHTATLMEDGEVLIAGGVGTGWTFLADAEIYDPRTGTFRKTGSMAVTRESHTATRLKDGKVLITGGHSGRRAEVVIYSRSEIFDPKSGVFSPTGDLGTRRHKHDATLLADGRVLIVGGSDERDGGGAYRNAEIYDPSKKTFAAVRNDMNTARYKLQGTALLLSSGKVLIAGGADRVEVFDPATETFTLSAGELGSNRLFATATLLSGGRVLITGGYHVGNRLSSSAWMFRS